MEHFNKQNDCSDFFFLRLDVHHAAAELRPKQRNLKCCISKFCWESPSRKTSGCQKKQQFSLWSSLAMPNSNSHFFFFFKWGINTFSTNFNDHSFFYSSGLNIFLLSLGGERARSFHAAGPQVYGCPPDFFHKIWAFQEEFAASQAGSTEESRTAFLQTSISCCLLPN